MKTMNIKADLTREIGVIRKIHGINNSVHIYHAPTTERQKELFKALKIPRVRYHDAALENPGYALVDISRIFPLFSADENNPGNYDFAPTDDYLKIAAESGAKIEFRLGESIEHSPNKYRVHPPKDFNKWADICLNVIRHYNEGWANGLHLDIEYWSVWEEPDNDPLLFKADYEEYLKLYDITAKKIKAAFPKLKVGGPQTMCGTAPQFEKFLDFCHKNSTPLDFVAWTAYFQSPSELATAVRKTEALVKQYGYPDAEINIAEWHYSPASWWRPAKLWEAEMVGAHSCAFTTGALTEFQDTSLSMAFFYCWSVWCYGLLESSVNGKPFPVYYAFKAFADMTDCEKRIAVSKDIEDEGVSVLAGRTSDGELMMLISCFKTSAFCFDIDTCGGNFSKCRFHILDDENLMTEISVLKKGTNGKFQFKHDLGGSAVYMLKFEK